MGTNPLLDVVPLPYSNEVLESYRILTDALETRIRDIVENKIESIKKRINRIIPSQNYCVEIFSQEEHSEILSELNEYDVQYPNRAFDDVYNFQITSDNARGMKWYIDLESNLKNWEIKSTVFKTTVNNTILLPTHPKTSLWYQKPMFIFIA